MGKRYGRQRAGRTKNGVAGIGKYWRWVPRGAWGLGHRQECLCYWKATAKAKEPARCRRYKGKGKGGGKSKRAGETPAVRTATAKAGAEADEGCCENLRGGGINAGL